MNAQEKDEVQKSAQESFNEILKKKELISAEKKWFKEECEQRGEYSQILDEIAILKKKKKEIEDMVSNNNSDRIKKMDELKQDLKEEKEVLSTLCISAEKAGMQLTLFDEYKEKYITKLTASVVKYDL